MMPIGLKANVRQRLDIEPHDALYPVTPGSNPARLGHAMGGERECAETIACSYCLRINPRVISCGVSVLHPLGK